MLHRRQFCLLLACLLLGSGNLFAAAGWKAGTAQTVITPEKPMWMAGYGARNRPAAGKLHDLWIKALALEDAQGHRAIILSSDTLGIPQSIYNNTCRALKEKFELEPSQIMLNSSHTHCGPVLRGALLDIYPLDQEQLALIEEYSTKLESQIVQIISEALSRLEPVEVFTGIGTTDFAVNRRNNLEHEVPELRKRGALKGPVDHNVPVLAVRTPTGELKAVVFGYACHNTTLDFYRWCGDYAGFAQMALERKYPGAAAMFMMGCGGDLNPLPRRLSPTQSQDSEKDKASEAQPVPTSRVELCEQYGEKLAAAVSDVLQNSLKPLKPTLQTELEMITLRLGAPATREELTQMAQDAKGYPQRWAARLLKQLKAGEPFATTYPYPVQVWRLGKRQLWITLGGEVVVDYSLGFKKAFGEDVWVTGYCNDVMAYIPSLRILEEDIPPRASSRWGYEGNRSMMVYGLPAHRWATDIEQLIYESAQRLVQRVDPSAKEQ